MTAKASPTTTKTARITKRTLEWLPRCKVFRKWKERRAMGMGKTVKSRTRGFLTGQPWAIGSVRQRCGLLTANAAALRAGHVGMLTRPAVGPWMRGTPSTKVIGSRCIERPPPS